jgi:hypothetical protein
MPPRPATKEEKHNPKLDKEQGRYLERVAILKIQPHSQCFLEMNDLGATTHFIKLTDERQDGFQLLSAARNTFILVPKG